MLKKTGRFPTFVKALVWLVVLMILVYFQQVDFWSVKAESSNLIWYIVYLGPIALLLVVLVIWGYSVKWTGFASYTYRKSNGQEFVREKTLWDWLQLLIVPLVIALASLVFASIQNTAEQTRTEAQAAIERNRIAAQAKVDQEIALDNLRDSTLQLYLDRMSELLLDKHLRSTDQTDEARTLATTRTRVVITRLDSDRQIVVLEFLAHENLINTNAMIVDIRGVDLTGIKLSRAELPHISLDGVKLSGAVLDDAVLVDTDLESANLSLILKLRMIRMQVCIGKPVYVPLV